MHPVHRLSRRLELREFQADDADAVFAIYGSEMATEHLSFEPRTLDEVRQIVTRSIEAATSDPRSEHALAVVERSTGTLVGAGRLALDPHQPGGATMGFALRPASWGSGYGVETVRLLLGLGFEELGLHRIWGARSPANEASAKTMDRAGMAEEGRIREHVRKGGVWRDSIVHAILDREWAARTT
ncbi:GNAT family N-acetyltransferase [Streptomyces sp. NL15-2K]|uniref:GNAT family N-acetyltransferase n=1 Tax=Streptomyces sp. NL15-2K TaxID=376149 RepID=UPI000F58BFFD|nr:MULTISPECIES: GNAT family protein [Actinomycetes]WKX10924.1 GNAT family protein [Kutzneria buriramensis]GCB47511.1 GCN5-related N-acetyltransferase [Streptomyces sp. NL15-2K]